MGRKTRSQDKKHKTHHHSSHQRQHQNNKPPIIEQTSQEHFFVKRTLHILSETIKTVMGAGIYLGLSYLPSIVTATAIPNVDSLRNARVNNDNSRSALSRRAATCNNSTQAKTWTYVGPSSSDPFFVNMNGNMLTAASGRQTGSAYYRILVNSFNFNNNPLFSKDLAVDANVWDAMTPFVIATEAGPVFCWQTVSTNIKSFCVPYTNGLQAAGSIQNVAYFNNYSQRNPRGASRNGGGYELVFESNPVYGNSNYFDIYWKGFLEDNITPINLQEKRVSTITNSNNMNSRVVVNPDNSGTILWQQKINGINRIVGNSYNTSRILTNPTEVTLTNTTLPNFDCVNPQVIKLLNGEYRLIFLSSPTPSANPTYNLMVQNISFYPTLQLIGAPVNLTANQGVGFYVGTEYNAMPTDNNGMRITASAYAPGAVPQGIKMEVLNNNTLTGGITRIDQISSAQTDTVVVDRGNGRYTIGYQRNSNVDFQTISASPFIATPNNVTINQNANNQTVSIPNVFVERTNYTRNQLTVTMQISSNLMRLSTNADVPSNANVNYDETTGTLTVSATGTTCEVDVNNILCGLQVDVIAYQRQSGTMMLTVSDDSGLPTYQTSMSVYISATNYIPTLHSAYLYIGQNGRANFILDISTVDNVPANSLNIFITNLNPSSANVEYVNGTQSVTGISQYTQNQNNQIFVQQSGSNSNPQFQIAVSSYDGQRSQPVQVNVNFYRTPTPINQQIIYPAKSGRDVTPVPCTSQNFNVLSDNSPSAGVYRLYYDENSHCGMYRKGDFKNRITHFTQADANNITDPVLFFIPDGSGEQPNLIIDYTDGYNTLPPTPVDIQYTIDATLKAKKQNNIFSITSASLSFTVWVVAKLGADAWRYRSNAFANFVKHRGSFFYISFELWSGALFAKFITEIVKEAQLKGSIEKNLDKHHYFRALIPFNYSQEEIELIRIATYFTEELKHHKEANPYIFMRLAYAVILGTPLNHTVIDDTQDSYKTIVKQIADNVKCKVDNNADWKKPLLLQLALYFKCAGHKKSAEKHINNTGLEMTSFDSARLTRQQKK